MKRSLVFYILNNLSFGVECLIVFDCEITMKSEWVLRSRLWREAFREHLFTIHKFHW